MRPRPRVTSKVIRAVDKFLIIFCIQSHLTVIEKYTWKEDKENESERFYEEPQKRHSKVSKTHYVQ